MANGQTAHQKSGSVQLNNIDNFGAIAQNAILRRRFSLVHTYRNGKTMVGHFQAEWKQAKQAIELVQRWDETEGKTSEFEVISEEQIAGLIALFQACGEWEGLDNDDYDQLFEDACPQDLAISAATILAESHVVSSIEAIARYVSQIDDDDSERIFDYETFLSTLANFGPETATEMTRIANDPATGEPGKMLLYEALDRMTHEHSELIVQLKPWLHDFLKRAEDHSPLTNGNAIAVAINWRFSEAAATIEQVFSSNLVDCGVVGDWEVVRRELDVEGKGLPMPEKPINLMEDFRKNVGLGCFSDKPIFMAGEIQEEAAASYYDRAVKLFSDSVEGQELPPESHFWTVASFLEFGINYLGVTVETMTVDDASEILFDLYPSKVSTDADNCRSIHQCLAAFWKFVAREYELENAAAIAEEIASSEDKFYDAMSDPANFGMAKGLVMAGVEAGFDMTSQEGMEKFMLAYNSNLANQRGVPMEVPGTVVPPATNRFDAPIEQVRSVVEGKTRKQRKKMLASKMKKRKKR